ncbi:hypothetical protein POM88_005580 [Heracleum sosnowskyi]|uniref:RRM domain-containing protein n=1 Tax=Heracleum sosnowskyi TaxID=360622 RepID=A0AAD8N4G2_9APIA|nr:hypothetical protein POM88_005580 [Heracleum sosnowskyi]
MTCYIAFYAGVLDLSTEDKLRAAFAPLGNVLSARIYKDGPNGNSKGSATVRYGTKEEAEKAQDALDDNRLGHNTVVPVEPEKLKPSEQEKMHSDTSYIAHRTSGYTQSTHCHTEAAGGKYTDMGEVKKQIIRKGDTINLKDLLFTKNRDYLVKNNNEQVCTVIMACGSYIFSKWDLRVPSGTIPGGYN